MDKDWILAFAFFMLFNNSPEVMSLLNSDNFDDDFKNALKELEAADPEEIKRMIVDKVSNSQIQLESINEAYKHRREE